MQEPRLVEREAFRVVGVAERYEQGKQFGIPAQWDRFLQRCAEVPDAVQDAHYGVCVPEPACGPASWFTYVAGTAVRSADRVPEGMSVWSIPAGTYAVFEHRGPISRIMETIRALWGEWLPAAGLEPTGGPDFERYDERFRGEDPSSVCEIWVPVAR